MGEVENREGEEKGGKGREEEEEEEEKEREEDQVVGGEKEIIRSEDLLGSLSACLSV